MGPTWQSPGTRPKKLCRNELFTRRFPRSLHSLGMTCVSGDMFDNTTNHHHRSSASMTWYPASFRACARTPMPLILVPENVPS